MKKVQLLTAVASLVLLTCLPCDARGGYKVNPHAPNGYNASMAGYHYHGTHAPSGEMNGYAASSIRSKHGMQPLLVPDKPSGGGGGRFSGGGGRFGGGGGNRFGTSESGRFGNNTESGGRFNRDGGRFGADREDSYNSEETGRFGGGRFSTGRFASQNYNNSNTNNQENYWSNHFRSRCEPQYNQVALNNPYAQSAQDYTTYSGSNQFTNQPTALRTMVSNHPVHNLLKNSQDGFNRIYTTE